MDQRYKELHKEVQKLRSKVQGLLDAPAHRLAQTLKTEVQRLEDEVEMSRAPRALEDRVKLIQRHLAVASEGGDNLIMNVEHADDLHNIFEDLRGKLRRIA
ncbi:MAG TPA: hypothetical protein VK694_02175 [Verrucomicrobiae bacterium]|nr:hypothetical protein [Verrucomicrobiae bacterium]